MMQWLKSVSSCLCILTIVLHLVPEGKFAKYVHFYAGLLFFLMTSEPVVELFVGDGELERLIKLEFLKEDYGARRAAPSAARAPAGRPRE